ncbi:hypothetical protein ACMU_15205 [Actibacterium mucosum KCTC 23349]|uniref:Uncharacterized protein n=1 Tax=Actibacterium mucosum KCTC 23349 TaxID=1454373 RepID=A0A037ZJT8_9RHOB|nr:molybdopterin-dependent oxidoreductase [Actibacterium mucosum]KAJ55101.1 hypothetical protein ACMU_15205 [Actibacterium mucosum KCTC 23349]
MNHHSSTGFAIAGAVCLAAFAASAEEGPALQVVSANPTGTTLELSLSDLDALPQVSFETSTIWTDTAITFSGVAMAEIIKAAGLTGSTVEMVALNDYAATIPMSDVAESAPIIATRIDGATLSVRDKGPFWVVFPYDADPKYQTETVYSQSVWQLSRLNILD